MSSWLSLSIEDVRELGARMRQHDSAADALLTQAQTVYRQVDSMREYCSEMNQLNEVASGRPRSALIHSIRQEDRYIMQLSQENRELRQALEEQRNVMELIMSKYREQVAKLLSGGGREGARGGQLALQRKLAANVERIREMVCVMREAAQLSERDSHAATATLARLHAENRNLREMMQIASAYGSVKPPGRADAATQTGGEGGGLPGRARGGRVRRPLRGGVRGRGGGGAVSGHHQTQPAVWSAPHPATGAPDTRHCRFCAGH